MQYINFAIIMSFTLGIGFVSSIGRGIDLLAQTSPSILSALEGYGIFGILVGFFIWWGWLREQRMSNRVTELENDFKEKLIILVKESAETIIINTEFIQEMKDCVKDLCKESKSLVNILSKSPCLVSSYMRGQIDIIKQEDGSVSIRNQRDNTVQSSETSD
uniref:Uncharacterized protein n=1 Tax=viral metagenome TaxID=1070528 RepID=A0A6M3LGX9_9ZZZZ